MKQRRDRAFSPGPDGTDLRHKVSRMMGPERSPAVKQDSLFYPISLVGAYRRDLRSISLRRRCAGQVTSPWWRSPSLMASLNARVSKSKCEQRREGTGATMRESPIAGERHLSETRTAEIARSCTLGQKPPGSRRVLTGICPYKKAPTGHVGAPHLRSASSGKEAYCNIRRSLTV